MIDYAATKARIKSLVESKGITQKALAKSCYVSASAVRKWYYVPDTLPSLENMVAIADLLEVSIDELIVRTE